MGSRPTAPPTATAPPAPWRAPSPPQSRSWSKCRSRPAWRSSKGARVEDNGLMALLERSPQALAPPPAEPAPDRAPDSLAGGVAQPLRSELEALLGPDRVLGRAGDLVK